MHHDPRRPLRGSRGRAWWALPLALVLALVAAACSGKSATTETGAGAAGTLPGGSSVPQGKGGTINLVAYSTPQEAYQQIGTAFQKSPNGKGAQLKESYGASGDQSRAVEGGQPADYVAFSLEPDMTRLVKGGKVAESWNQNPYNGMVTNSVVVFIVRKGNPKGIKTWDDLTKPGVEVLTPNPFTSGGARWNVMAGYAAKSNGGKDEQAGKDYLMSLFKNVVVQDDSARKSLQTFSGGKGDVLLGYENEAIFAQQKGEQIDYVVPDQTILIENPAAVTKDSKNPDTANAFLAFVYTPEAQEIFVKNGYRPVVQGVPGADKFPKPTSLYTIKEFGGWTEVQKKFFDPKGSIMADVERSIGVSVESK
jgi:sulfate/thiosulfate transport system substrate-binding protein